MAVALNLLTHITGAGRKCLRALHVTPYFAPAFRYGGPPQSILGLCRGLIAAGVHVEVLTTTANGDDELSTECVRRGNYDGIPVRYLPRCFPRRYFNASGLPTVLTEIVPSMDLVHVHGLWNVPAWIAARECQRASVPYVISPRGMLDGGSLAHHRWRKELAYRLWERRYLARAALLHTTSSNEQENLERLSLGPRIVCVPNGISLPAGGREVGFRKRLGLSSETRVVVYLGRLHPTKRLDLLMSAYEKVRLETRNVHLVLAGPQDGLDGDALVRSASHPGSVCWIGELSADEKWALLSEADVVVSCSDSESFGLSIVEAMAMATPVVVTRTCPWEDVEAHRAGFWIAQDAGAIAGGILEVLRDPDEAAAMGERGQRLVRERYQWSVTGNAMASLYAQVA